MNNSEITHLCQQAENEYSAFLNELQKLEVAEYPTSASQDFIRELRNEANFQKKQLTQKRKAASGSPGQLGSVKLEIHAIKAIRANLISNLMVYLDWVSGAQTRKVPWSFIPSAEDLAQRIIPKRKVILYCENQYNYRIVWCENPNPVKRFQQYCFVSLPRLHRTNILMHVWIGHELFHPLCKKFTEEKKRKAGENIANTVREVFKDLKKPRREIAHLNDLLMIAWERALQEILCDIALGKIFGPAGLLAMRSFASFSDRRGKLGPETQFYPPWQYRFEVVWQRGINKEALKTLLEDVGEAGKDFQDEITEFGKTLKSNEGAQYVTQYSFYKIAYTEVNNLLSEAAEFVDSKLPKDLPKWSDDNILNQVHKLVDRLLNGLPPNEIPNYTYNSKKLKGSYAPEPAGVPAILTAGWIYESFRERAQGRGQKDVLDHASLSRLLLKACEDSEMLKSCR